VLRVLEDLFELAAIHSHQDEVLADKINEAFVSVMQNYYPLPEDVCVALEYDEPITVIELEVCRKLREISISCAAIPKGPPFVTFIKI
jgi:hypothetical protein